MPSPIANFGYIVNGTQVTFSNLSLNTTNDTVYNWDLGDGNITNMFEPIHAYSAEGFYNVTLEVTNNDGSSTITALVNTTPNINPGIKTDIPTMIDLYSPTTVIGTIKYNQQKDFLITKWQEYIQPLLYNPEVTPENTHNSSAWPFLANQLIAKLVVIDIIEMEAAAMLMGTAIAGQQNNSDGGGNTSTRGALKTVETGPAKTEFYDIQNTTEGAANLAKAFGLIIKPGGVLDELKRSACQDAGRIDIYLPMCGLPKRIMNIKVTESGKKGKYAANPFGITPRMT